MVGSGFLFLFDFDQMVSIICHFKMLMGFRLMSFSFEFELNILNSPNIFPQHLKLSFTLGNETNLNVTIIAKARMHANLQTGQEQGQMLPTDRRALKKGVNL